MHRLDITQNRQKVGFPRRDPEDVVCSEFHVDVCRQDLYEPNGSIDRPYRSIQEAVNKANELFAITEVLSPVGYPVIVVHSGYYPEDVVLTESVFITAPSRNAAFIQSITGADFPVLMISNVGIGDLTLENVDQIGLTGVIGLFGTCTIIGSDGVSFYDDTRFSNILITSSLVYFHNGYYNNIIIKHDEDASHLCRVTFIATHINNELLTQKVGDPGSFYITFISAVLEDDFSPIEEVTFRNYGGVVTGVFTQGDSTYVNKGGYPVV